VSTGREARERLWAVPKVRKRPQIMMFSRSGATPELLHLLQ